MILATQILLFQVHARCYGELEPLDGVLWLCNLCRPGAPEQPPPCCLCPVTGAFFFCILFLVSALPCLVLEEYLVTIMTIIDLFPQEVP